MKKTRITEKEMPYGILEKFGLTKTMIEDLPKRVQDSIHDGNPSPVLPVRVQDNNGNVTTVRARFRIARHDDGRIDVAFTPRSEEATVSNFPTEQQQDLYDGKVILADYQYPNGVTMKSYLQYDKDTNRIIAAPANIINQNLNKYKSDLTLTPAEEKKLSQGSVVTFIDDDGNTVSIGLDLRKVDGVRFCIGDEKDWKQRKEMGQYNFGALGCWVADNDGNLNYVDSDDYDDEMNAILEERIEKKEKGSIKR